MVAVLAVVMLAVTETQAPFHPYQQQVVAVVAG
jgi:hypothetical protein